LPSYCAQGGFKLTRNSFCCILNVASINLTWLLTVLGIIVGGASIPVGLILLWSRMSTIAVLLSPWIGFFSGLIAWFVVTKLRSGAINVATTGDPKNAVAGNITSWGVGFVCAVVLTFAFPKKFESTDEYYVARANKINGIAVAEGKSQTPPSGGEGDGEKKIEPASDPAPDTIVPTGNHIVDFLETSHITPLDPVLVRRATRLAVGFNLLFLAVAILFVPFLLFGGEWVFPRQMFVGWCVVSFLWVWCSMIICVVWPVVESWATIWRIVKGVVADVGGRGKGK
jgi:hypothetical protein